jgi:hypothetical protein
VRAALVSPRVEGVRLAPSWAAVERVLYLAALDRGLRATASDAAPVRAALYDLRALIDRHAPALYAATPVADARELVWIGRAREAIAAGSPTERAAVLVWAAVASWTDAPSGRWSMLADAGTVLAEALDGAVLGWRHPVETARVATKLRAVMAETWREMEGGR